MAADGRKSLMISVEAHTRINRLADQHNVSQHVLVDALLRTTDEVRLGAALQEIARQTKLSKAEQKEKERMLKEALSDMTPAQLEAILKQAGKA